MLLATVYFSSLAFYVMEHGPNPLVKGYGDALWWAFMDVTTVGSNIIAVTPTGRFLGICTLAIFFHVLVIKIGRASCRERVCLYV